METNSLYEQVKKILKNKNAIDVYVDMDGVLAEYKYGEGEKILKGDTSVYLNKRPILTIIKFIKKYYKKNNFFILTSCVSQEQEEIKKKWLKINMPFFDLNNFYCIITNNFDERISKKVDLISSLINKRNHYSILIEDTHEILKKTWNLNKEKLLPVLVINLIK